MQNQDNNQQQQNNADKPTGKFPVTAVIAAAAVLLCAALVFFTNAKHGTNSGNPVTIRQGESLVIPMADITENASFFAAKVDGTPLEVIAVRDSKGTIRTAYNTCQVCHGSGRAYYRQDGSDLVCQNCGNRFSMDMVEREAGGCNPWPIFDSDKTVADGQIRISYNVLQRAASLFRNWKVH